MKKILLLMITVIAITGCGGKQDAATPDAGAVLSAKMKGKWDIANLTNIYYNASVEAYRETFPGAGNYFIVDNDLTFSQFLLNNGTYSESQIPYSLAGAGSSNPAMEVKSGIYASVYQVSFDNDNTMKWLYSNTKISYYKNGVKYTSDYATHTYTLIRK